MEIFINYGNMKFNDPAVPQTAVKYIIQAMTNDKNSLVRIKAACALNMVIRNESAVELCKPYLKDILAIYVRMMNEYDLEELVNSL